ncbi:hypothetical protein OG618_25655 [Kitasatospora sp. NBC_01246]|uniref:hypothetical protein n=1 Tax=Kitasatospora sp. NBC_01246 TaxID=2903570 RepID=UPI002E3579EE|nr:hypothetical protein [Kitasatospora sp. NBC_01246]
MPEQKPAEEGGKEGRRRIDLSVAQVAASALATVVGALLASELGVYGTILGAAVVSVGATTGGAVFQHLFRRTGEQLRGAVDRTGPGPVVNGLRQVPDSDTRGPVISPAWNEPRVVRARRRWTWKSYGAVSALVFVLAMMPILAFELATGQPVSATVKGESGSGTSLGGTVAPKPADPPTGDHSGGPSRGTGGASPSPSAGSGGAASEPATPGGSPSAGSGGTASPSAGPSGTPSGSPSAGPSTGPSASPSASPSGGPSGGSSAPTGSASKPAGSATPAPPAPSGAPTGPAAG